MGYLLITPKDSSFPYSLLPHLTVILSEDAHDTTARPQGHDTTARPQGHDTTACPQGHDTTARSQGHDTTARPQGGYYPPYYGVDGK